MKFETLICILLSIGAMGCSKAQVIPPPASPVCQKGELKDGWMCIGGLNEYDTGFWRCMQKTGCKDNNITYPFNTDRKANGIFCADRRAPDIIQGYRCEIRKWIGTEIYKNQDNHIGTWVCDQETCDCMGDVINHGVGCSMDGIDCDSVSLCPENASPLTGYRKGELYCQGEPKSAIGATDDMDKYICSHSGWRCENGFCKCGKEGKATFETAFYEGCRNGEVTCGGEIRSDISDNPKDDYRCDREGFWKCESKSCSCGHGTSAITIPKGSGCMKGREVCNARSGYEPETRPYAQTYCDMYWTIDEYKIVSYYKPQSDAYTSHRTKDLIPEGYQLDYDTHSLKCVHKDGCTCNEKPCPNQAWCIDNQCICGGKEIQPGYQCDILKNEVYYASNEIEYGRCGKAECACGNGTCPQNTQCDHGNCLCNDHLMVSGDYQCIQTNKCHTRRVGRHPEDVDKDCAYYGGLVCENASGCQCGPEKVAKDEICLLACPGNATFKDNQCYCGDTMMTDLYAQDCAEVNGKFRMICGDPAGCACNDRLCPASAYCQEGECFDPLTDKPVQANNLLIAAACHQDEGCPCGNATCSKGEFCFAGKCTDRYYARIYKGKRRYYDMNPLLLKYTKRSDVMKFEELLAFYQEEKIPLSNDISHFKASVGGKHQNDPILDLTFQMIKTEMLDVDEPDSLPDDNDRYAIHVNYLNPRVDNWYFMTGLTNRLYHYERYGSNGDKKSPYEPICLAKDGCQCGKSYCRQGGVCILNEWYPSGVCSYDEEQGDNECRGENIDSNRLCVCRDMKKDRNTDQYICDETGWRCAEKNGCQCGFSTCKENQYCVRPDVCADIQEN